MLILLHPERGCFFGKQKGPHLAHGSSKGSRQWHLLDLQSTQEDPPTPTPLRLCNAAPSGGLSLGSAAPLSRTGISSSFRSINEPERCETVAGDDSFVYSERMWVIGVLRGQIRYKPGPCRVKRREPPRLCLSPAPANRGDDVC